MIKKESFSFGLFTLVLLSIHITAGHALPANLGERQIIFKGDHYYPPYEFINEKGEPDGFDVELFRALADELKLDIKIELGPWNIVREELEQGKIDGVTGIIYSQERAKLVDFGIPHSIINHALFVPKTSMLVSLSDLKDKTVLVQKGDRLHDYLKSSGLARVVIATESQLEALKLLAAGKADAALIGTYQGAHLIKKYKLNNIEARTIDFEPQKFGFAVAKGHSELLELLNAGLFQLKAKGKYDELFEKWFSVYDQDYFYNKNKPYILGMITIFLVLLVFVLLLKIQVRIRTRELRNQKEFLEILINTIPNPLFYINRENNFVGWNKAFMELFRKAGEDEPEPILTAQDIEAFAEVNSQPPGEYFEPKVEKQITIPATGEKRDVIMQEAVLRSEDKKVTGFIAVITDITERKSAENELAMHRNELEEIVQARTAELELKNEELLASNRELERLNNLFVGREFRIKELKEKIAILEEKLIENKP